MEKKQIVRDIIVSNGGIASTADFVAEDISRYEVASYCKDGVVKRIRRGFYKLPDDNPISEEKLLKAILPQGIICIESALFYYKYSDFVPRQWSIAVPRTATRAVNRVVEFPMKAYYVQKEFLDIGRTTGNFNGVTLPIYDRERTICDCFKYRTKLDREIFIKAVNAYASDKSKNLANLSIYARKMGIYTKVFNLMEVLLNE